MLILSFFSGTTMALNVDEWVYKETQGNLQSSPGCTTKEIATAKAQKPYRVKKSTELMCQHEGYGWSLSEIKDTGTVVCDECEGDVKGKYRCYLSNVKVQCKIIKRGW